MTLFRLARENSLRLSFSIILLAFFILLNAQQITYNVRHGIYRGISHIEICEMKDNVLITYNTSVNWGIVKIKNECAFFKYPPRPDYIETEFNAVFKNYRGGTVFFDTAALYYQKNDTIYNYGPYEPNDWLLLPFFMAYVSDSVYECSLLQGDYVLERTIHCDTVYWQSSSGNTHIVIYDGIPVRFSNSNSEFVKQ